MSLSWDWRVKNDTAEGRSQEVFHVDIGMGSDWRESEEERLVSLDSLGQKPIRLFGEDIGRILSFVAHRW